MLKNTILDPEPDILIKKLSLKEHKKILSNIKYFWITKSPIMRPLHHAVFSLLFSDFSFVLYKNSQIVSYVYAAYNGNKGFIHIIATRAGLYRKKYASVLLYHLEKAAREKKLKSIWAYCLSDNFQSRSFFEKNQFIMQKEIDISTDEKRILFKKVINH